ncbi:IS3 family transposase [Cytobacillus praedii]
MYSKTKVDFLTLKIKVIEIANQYMCNYNEKRIQAKLNYLSSDEYRRHVV